MPDLPDYYTQTLIAEAEAARFKGGLDANKPDDPVSKDLYLATDTKILYICVVDDNWTGFDASILVQGILTLYANMLGGGFQIKNIADPTAAQDAATRAYVLARCGLYLPLAGGAVTGAIAMGANKITGLANPTAAQDAATRAYVLAQCGLYLPLAGGTLTGALLIDDETYIQLGIIQNFLRLIPWQEAAVGGLVFRPGEGNRACYFAMAPSGTSETSQVSLFNAPYGPGTEDYSVFSMKVIGDTVHFVYEDAGTPPKSIAKVKLWNDWHTNDIIPNVDHYHSLGSTTLHYGEVYAYHHHIVSAPYADHKWSGITTRMTAGTGLTIGQAVYVHNDSKMGLARADMAALMPAIALATETIADNAEGEFLLQGFFRDDTWDWTPGGLLYISEDTAGALTQELPAANGEQVQVVGVAITADIIHFNPSYELVEVS